MKANITAVGKNLTLSRGATLNSTNTGVINFIYDPLTENSLTNARASGFVYKSLQGQPFIADTSKTISFEKHYFNNSIRFFNEKYNQTLVSSGTFGTALTEVSVNVSSINPQDVFILKFSDSTISDPEDTISVNVQATSWSDFIIYVNSYFSNGGYYYPYQVSYENGILTLKNIYNVATLYTISLTKLSENTSSYIAFTSNSDLETNFFEFSDSIAIIKEGLTLGTTPDQDMLIGSYLFVDDDEIELASVRSELDTNGTIKICLRAKNLADGQLGKDPEVLNEELALYIAKDGTIWATAPDPNDNATGNEIATARWVRKVTAGGMQYKGPFDASAGNYNAISDSHKGWMYVVTTAGVINGIDWKVGDFLVVDADGATSVTKIDNTESDDLVRLDAIQTLTNKTLTSPTLTGTPVTTTAATGTRTTQIASTQFVGNEINALKDDTYFVKTGNNDQDVDGIKSWKKYINRKLQSYSPLSTANVVDYIYKVVDASNDANLAVEVAINRDVTPEAVRLKNTVYNVNIGSASNFAGYDFVLSDNKGFYLEYVPENATYNLAIPAGDNSNKIPSTSWIQTELATAIAESAPEAATTSALGLVKPDGSTITVSSGTISVPTATSNALGLVKPDGSTIAIDSNGVISVVSTLPSGNLVNTATGVDSLTILGTVTTSNNALNIGSGSSVSGDSSIAIGYNASSTAENAIQLGTGTNSIANSFQVGSYNLLDLSSGLIPDARLNLIDSTTNKIKSSYIDSSVFGSVFVDTTTEQNIGGAKTFNGSNLYINTTNGLTLGSVGNAGSVITWTPYNTTNLTAVVTEIDAPDANTARFNISSVSSGTPVTFGFDFVNEKLVLPATPSSSTYDTTAATTQFVRNYQIPVTTISATSGTVELSANNIYKISATGNMSFTLTTPTDTTVYNQIKVMLQTANTPTIIWGTTTYYNNQEPDITTDGYYSVYFDWDANINGWVCGSLTIPSA